MPATEQTWRNQKLMHTIFGVGGLLMLLTTIWMFAKDHTREWKPIQATQRKIDQFFIAGRISEAETTKHIAEVSGAEEALAQALSADLDPAKVAAFKAEAEGFDFGEFDEQAQRLPALAAAAREAEATAQAARQEADTLLAAAQAAESAAEGAAAEEDAPQKRSAAVTAMQQAHAKAGEARAAQNAAAEVRRKLLQTMRQVIDQAKFTEDKLLSDKKFKAADLTATLSQYDIAVGEGKPAAEAEGLQAKANEIKLKLADITEQLDDAGGHRRRLEKIYKGPEGIIAAEEQAAKKVADSRADLERLHAQVATFTNEAGRALLGMPILDAFDNSDARIEQIWLPDLKINYNFSNVARFDRCVTCHRAIDKTAPGSPVDPAYELEHPPIHVSLETPESAPQPTLNAAGEMSPPTTVELYGVELAEEGLVDSEDVLVKVVRSESPGAAAGLRMGDVITKINGTRLLGREQALGYLLTNVRWGSPLNLEIRRGLPHPYASHPRLDLYLGSLSPHKKEEMGCTVCHDGQGSATAFKWASHSPNTPRQGDDWYREYGWFDNHHWIYPMYPERFVESGCLKCHHQVEELSPSDRFPEPPAAKLMAGYDLILSNGCYGCHEINGYAGPDQTIGPDLRTEPNYFAVAQALLAHDTGFSERERAWAERLVNHPEDDATRRKLYNAIVDDKQLATIEEDEAGEADEGETEVEPHLTAFAHKMGEQLKDIETPGTLRKVGPSLRYLASKVDFEFLYGWIRQPSDFRPSTKMPQFFGLTNHLNEQGKEISARYEPVEIRAISEYLLAASEPFEYLPRPEGVTEEASPERGAHLFQTRGCLACHSQNEFPGAKADQGPDLTGLAAKLNTANGSRWLYTWLRDPSKYHVRTKMPDLMLAPITDAEGRVSDPAADIAAYLLSGKAEPLPAAPAREVDGEEQKALFELALEYLAKSYPRKLATRYLQEGIPAERADEVKGDDLVLLGMTPETRVAKQLQYVGRRAISKYGCTGCHDVPGYEDSKPIGTGLADWGRKETSKLAFEQIANFLEVGGHGGGHGAHQDAGHHGPENGLTAKDRQNPDVAFYLEQFGAHSRQGFIWQKLRMPRSYDYEKTDNKDYNDRLRMPQFNLSAEEREQIITFVLGLVAEPPADKYIYSPDPRQKAIVEGRQVLDKYNCAGCHTLQMDRWEFDYHEDDFYPAPPIVDYPFLNEPLVAAEVRQSLKQDRRGMRHAIVHGRPMLDETTGQPELRDEDGLPIEEDDPEVASFFNFELWRDAMINGEPRRVGVQNLQIRATGVKKYPAWGGDLANYLFPVVIALEKQINPAVKGGEAWGWLPPPLVGEGRKVQTPWLHDFLLNPYPIRPATVLRMPKFNMSSEEATKLANYFAAVDGEDYPYEYDPRTSSEYLAARDASHPDYLGDALKIVIDSNYCVKCHLVGDYSPGGSPTALGPNLDQVANRLRPEYVRNWIANPKRLLPYTGMPVNIPYQENPPHFGGVNQELFHGTSVEQLNGLVDFLMNYDRYTRRQLSIKPLVERAAPQAEPAEGAESAPAAETENETGVASPLELNDVEP